MSTSFKLLTVLTISPLLSVCCLSGEVPPDNVEPGTNLSHFVGGRVDFVTKPDTFFELHTTNQMLLVVRGITIADRQEQVLSAVKEWQGTNQSMARVTVRFYGSGGYYNGIGLPPIILREVSIVLSNKRDGGDGGAD